MPSRLIVTLLLAAAMSACRPATVPMPNPTEANATVLAEANAVLTETRSAETPRVTPTHVVIGTPTPLGTMPFGTIEPLDATQTALAVQTALPLTGATATGSAASASAAAGTQLPVTPSVPNIDPACNRALDPQGAGPRIRLVITNSAEYPLALTIGISNKNSFDECGYLYWGRVDAGEQLALDVPESHPELGDSCYWVNALIRSKPTPQWLSEGGLCLTGGQRWTIDITLNHIVLKST